MPNLALAEKARIVNARLHGNPSIRLISNGVNVGRSAVLCRNIMKGKLHKDPEVQTAREQAVERLYVLQEKSLDLRLFAGRELSFNDLQHAQTEADAETLDLNEKNNFFYRSLHELNYWVQNYPRRFNAVSSQISYGGGDLLAQLIVNGGDASKINYWFVGGMMLVGSYYSQEIPFVYKFITDHIKGDTFGGKLARWGVSLFGYDPIIFNPRHVLATRFLAGADIGSFGDVLSTSFQTWASSLPITGPYDYLVINHIPQKYRFLAVEALNLAWSTWAAVNSLLRGVLF